MHPNFSEYQDLDVWKESYRLATKVYEATNDYPNHEVYGITQQSRRASISVISNISEGCGRNHTKDKLQFFFIARGSLFELEAQLAVASKLGYIGVNRTDNLLKQTKKCKLLLSGFISYHKRKIK